MKHLVKAFLALWIAVPYSLQASPDDWKSRSIYQVVTDRFARSDGSTTAPCDPGEGVYCGGSWQGLIKRLDYIQGMGFSAVWISPVTLNLLQKTKDLESYHGYWQQDLYAVNPRFGTMEDLKDLSDALHKRDMYLMLDVVVGNMAFAGAPEKVDYSVFDPFNQQDSFHPYCPMPDAGNVTGVQEVSRVKRSFSSCQSNSFVVLAW
jgi:alpha-amylase